MVFCAFLAGITAYGYATSAPYLWLPVLALTTTIIYLPFHQWVVSDRLGRAVLTSTLIKFALSLIGFVSTISGWASVVMAAYWAYIRW